MTSPPHAAMLLIYLSNFLGSIHESLLARCMSEEVLHCRSMLGTARSPSLSAVQMQNERLEMLHCSKHKHFKHQE